MEVVDIMLSFPFYGPNTAFLINKPPRITSKKLIKDAILDGNVKNNKEDALLFLNKKAEEYKIERNEI